MLNITLPPVGRVGGEHMGSLEDHFALIAEEMAAAAAAPLSLRRARACLVLVDLFADRVFQAAGAGSAAAFGCDDVLAFRARLRAECPALGLIADVCAATEGGSRLTIASMPVPAGTYAGLGIEDRMVSVYSEGTVERVVIAGAEGTREVHEVLAEAVKWWTKESLLRSDN